MSSFQIKRVGIIAAGQDLYVLSSIQPINRLTDKIQQRILVEGLEPGYALRLETDGHTPGSKD